METYTLNICGLKRELPIIDISDDLAIASFVILGDTELVCTVAPRIAELLPEIDILISAEAKGIPLIHELSRIMRHERYIVARKSVKSYMNNVVKVEVNAITTATPQILCLNAPDVKRIRNKQVGIVDDVVSTGSSIEAVEKLVKKAGGQVAAKACILAEGEAKKRNDLIYLETLPVFER